MLCFMFGACDRRTASDGPPVETIMSNGAIRVTNYNAPQGWADVVILQEELRIGSRGGSGPEVFGGIVAIAIDDYGRIYVGDTKNGKIIAFDDDGKLLGDFGRMGSGPGEFVDITGFVLSKQGQLWVYDPVAFRLSVFDTSGTFLGSSPWGPFRYFTIPWAAAIDSANYLYDRQLLSPVGDSLPTYGFVRHVMGDYGVLTPVDTFTLPDYPTMMYIGNTDGIVYRSDVPFSPSLKSQVDDRGGVWLVETDRYQLTRVSFSGDTLHVIERAYSASELTAQERDSVVQETGIEASLLPRNKPVIRDFIVGEDCSGFLVQTYTPHEEPLAHWDVFDSRGHYMGVVATHLSLYSGVRPILRGGKLYAVALDDFDVPYVVRMALPAVSNSGPCDHG